MSGAAEYFLDTDDGARIWYARASAVSVGAESLLCLSGGPGCCDYLGPVAAMLADAYTTVRVDGRGCGRSTRTGPYTIARSVADLEMLRVALGGDRWNLLGHSAGGDLALAYALAHPERVQTLVCIAGGRIHHDRDWRAVYEFNRDHVGEPLPPAEFPYNMHVNRSMSLSWRAYCKAPHLLQRIARLPMPVHYILAGEDIRPNWPLEQVARLAPHGSVHYIHGAPHNVWLTHADALRACLRQLLGNA